MKATEHAPVPWKVGGTAPIHTYGEDFGVMEVVDKDGNLLALVPDVALPNEDVYREVETQEAITRLMAGSPTLLEAAELAEGLIDAEVDTENDRDAAYVLHNLRTAIAKTKHA